VDGIAVVTELPRLPRGGSGRLQAAIGDGGGVEVRSALMEAVSPADHHVGQVAGWQNDAVLLAACDRRECQASFCRRGSDRRRDRATQDECGCGRQCALQEITP